MDNQIGRVGRLLNETGPHRSEVLQINRPEEMGIVALIFFSYFTPGKWSRVLLIIKALCVSFVVFLI